MATVDLSEIARAVVADGKGIPAADETGPTITRRLAALQIEPTPESRRAYRAMLFTTPGVSRANWSPRKGLGRHHEWWMNSQER